MAPELEIATEYQNTLVTNYFFYQTFGGTSVSAQDPNFDPDDVFIDISEELAVEADPDALIDMVAGKLLDGEISQVLRDEIGTMLALITGPDSGPLRVGETIYLVVTSPEFAYQK